MKKVFAIVLIVCLAMTAVFADKGDFKLGAQVGLGTDAIKLTQSDSIYSKTNNSGFYFAGTGEYFFSDAFAGKVEFGINTMGKGKTVVNVGSLSYDGTASDASPLQLSAYVGGEFNIELSKTFDLLIGAGWDMMIGKESNADDAKTNAAMGLGLEAIGALELSKGLDLTFGVKFGAYFVNSDDQIKKDLQNINSVLSYLGTDDVKVGHSSFKFFAGITYAL